MSEHNRRDGYWKYYHQAHTLEKDATVRNIVALVKENPPPRPEKKSNRGRKPVHSWEKMVCICILMVIFNLTYRKMQNEVPFLKLPWNEPYPDHSWIAKSFKKIPLQYLESILQKTALMCIRESNWKGGMIGADSTGVETDVYDKKERPVKHRNEEKKGFEKARVKRFLKWHIIAILDCMVILACSITSSNAHDSPVLRRMLKQVKGVFDLHLNGSTMNADRAYDGEANYESLYDMNIHPNIRQREGSVNKILRYRKKASKEFDLDVYHYRGLVEGIFGAEEKANHKLHCRYIIKKNQRRFGMIKSIGWNVMTLNRLQCANRLGIQVLPYAMAN